MIDSIVKINGYNPFKALMLREYWENRRAIFTTPLVITAISMTLIIISMGLFGQAMHFNNESYTLSQVIDSMSTHEAQDLREKINRLLLASTLPIMIGAWLCMVFTALGALYDERKDNSILFWKSMPVSDLQTVLAKLLTVTLVIPFVALGFTLIFQIFLLIVGSFATISTDYNAWNLLWTSANLPVLLLTEMTYIVMYSLWALPIFAWFMLASVIAKRTPLLLASIPVALLALFESLLFQTGYLGHFIVTRLAGAHIVGTDDGSIQNSTSLSARTPLDILQSAAKPEFWIGLGIAAVLLYAVIVLRKRNSL